MTSSPPDRARRRLLARSGGTALAGVALGALCETMRLLIEAGQPPDVQQDFFAKYIAGWSTRCLQDIAAAPDADFFRAVAAFALAFFELESQHEILAT